MPALRWIVHGGLALALATALAVWASDAQVVAVEMSVSPVAASPSSPVATSPATSTSTANELSAQPAGKPADAAAKAAETPEKPGERGKPGTESKPVSRPATPSTPPDPKELKVRPDKIGKVRMNFNGQPWQGVLEWLAEISGMSLDWQELPGDYLNLTTQQSYTVPEVRDLINRHLLARGFTLLREGEVLTVVNIKKLDPSMVPRLAPGDLAKRDPHEFVKVSFQLDPLVAETLVEELKPMLSPNGKLTPLAESNRVEAMDAVINLRDIHAVLKDQQSTESQQRLVREFKLQHARAREVHDLLVTLLGVESKPGGAAGMMPQPGQSPEQMQALMMARMQQQGGMPGQPPPGMAAPKPARSPVSLAIDERRNTILVHARPDKMAIIVQVVEAVDVPLQPSGSLLASMNRMQIYRLSGIDPEPVVKTLRDIGNLDPATRLEVDKKNHAIVAYAALADHVTIRALVDKLTGSERKFEVIRLRRLSADSVAGSIDFMLGTGQKKEKPKSNPFFGSYDSTRRDQPEATKEFHVDADVEHNRLLLWANDVELAAVADLLVKLGEIPAKGENGETVRVVEGGSAKEAGELVERIRRAWPSVAVNPLEVAPADAPPKADERREASPPPSGEDKAPPEPPKATLGRPAPSAATAIAYRSEEPAGGTVDGGPAADPRPPVPPAAQAPSAGRPARQGESASPVRISVGADGRLVISSADTQALDRIEELAARLAAPHRDFQVFHLKYAWAVGVSLNLQDFFKEEKKEKTRMLPWYYDFGSDEETPDDDRRLSKRRKLRFISDADSNTILVEGADANQLRTVEELIQLYDQPPPTDSQSVRKTEVVHLKYSKANRVAETLKDVYRDLLSANDKALGGNQAAREPQRGFVYNVSDADKTEQKTPKFKGLLSIGVDEASNTLVLSAPAYLFEHVMRMIQELDEAAAPNYTVQVVKLGPGITPARVQELLPQLLGPNVTAGKSTPPQPPARPAAKPRAKPAAKPAEKPAQDNAAGR